MAFVGEYHRVITRSIVALAALTTAIPALAQSEEAAPAPAVTVSGSASITSDYRFRGVSQSDQ